jgi:hypothetical protein
VQVAFISELLKDRLYLTLNTRLDSNQVDSALNFKISSYRLTLSLFRQVLFNEVLLSYQREYKRDDLVLDTYLIEADHRF